MTPVVLYYKSGISHIQIVCATILLAELLNYYNIYIAYLLLPSFVHILYKTGSYSFRDMTKKNVLKQLFKDCVNIVWDCKWFISCTVTTMVIGESDVIALCVFYVIKAGIDNRCMYGYYSEEEGTITYKEFKAGEKIDDKYIHIDRMLTYCKNYKSKSGNKKSV